MNNEMYLHNTLQLQIKQWLQELDNFGFLKSEGDIIVALKTIEGKDRQNEATLLSLLAQSRSYRQNGLDELSQAWIQKAKELDPSNHLVQQFYIRSILNTLKELPDHLDFPPIRETDNRTAKRKFAETYIDKCRSFLDCYMDEQDKVKAALLQQGSTNDIYYQKLKSWNEIFQVLHDKVIKLLKASEEYYTSLTGVFYTSIHLEDMRELLDEISTLKSKIHEKKENQNKVSSSLDELDEMIGLEQVKNRVNKHYHYLQYQKMRKELGFSMKDEVNLNMIITGNPGTGKTTLARLLAKIYHELKVLPKSEVIEVDRSQLVGSFVGQTEENVKNVIKRSFGGVLFIDEAYSLKREGQSGNDYGQIAIDTLVSAMTSGESAGQFAVILAGYPEEMRQFLWTNPGLRSRFPESNHIQLPDYSTEELIEIGKKVALDNDYSLTEDALVELAYRIEKERVDESFGNARTVKSIIMEAIFQKGATTILDEKNALEFTLLEKDDISLLVNEEGTISPEVQMNELIGLSSIKGEIKKIQHFVQIQQVRKEKGLLPVPIQLHAVFTGNPGTGKTTIASIYASLLKECGLLKRGHLITASRADLVAGFVGQTAMKTKKKIREALGGVLFIDEAYSLVSGSTTDFGREAVDTLVEEMTKHNENLVVILAGYTSEMNTLLSSNPGLKSRFKKFFHFPDYSPSEIVDIVQKRVKQYEYELSEDALLFLMEYVKVNVIEGNGRFAVNLTEDLLQIQAARIMEQTEIDEKEFSIIYVKDMEQALMS